MKVVFDHVPDFLNELKRVETILVRIHPRKQAINNGVSEMFLRAGFIAGGDLNELTQHCGETFHGDESNEMLDQYKSLEDEIREFCKAGGIEVRGGEYDG